MGGFEGFFTGFGAIWALLAERHQSRWRGPGMPSVRHTGACRPEKGSAKVSSHDAAQSWCSRDSEATCNESWCNGSLAFHRMLTDLPSAEVSSPHNADITRQRVVSAIGEFSQVLAAARSSSIKKRNSSAKKCPLAWTGSVDCCTIKNLVCYI